MSEFSCEMSEHDTVRAIQWRNDALYLLDQRKLPEQVEYERFETAEEVAEAIRSMRVRGAPAIGIAAAYGVVLAVGRRWLEDPLLWRALVEQDLEMLAASRPTAVNLFWALERMRAHFRTISGDPVSRVLKLALQWHKDDIAANRRMGESGARLLDGAKGVLTHCNTGSLATGGYGTALGVIRSAYHRGVAKIFATETRPWLQGARLTLWELQQDKIPATLIVDSAAAWLMRSGAVQWVAVGADRIAANGDTANKIGTYALALSARRHGVKMMVVAPTSTIDWQTDSGAAIKIEERSHDELLMPYYREHGEGVDAWNPVFDVTPAELIDAIVTERGVAPEPGIRGLATLR
jgi:methylthioribose-1-phosphate isomerase